jgi:hypothetical protein
LFSDSFVNQQGIHKQVTTINRADPVSLPFGNGILYSKNDSLGNSQLYWYNAFQTIALTPGDRLYPNNNIGSATLAGNASQVIFPDPGYRYCATGFTLLNNSSAFKYWTIVRAGSNNIQSIAGNSGSAARPDFVFGGGSGNDLMVVNDSSSPQTVVWSVIYTRIS